MQDFQEVEIYATVDVEILPILLELTPTETHLNFFILNSCKVDIVYRMFGQHYYSTHTDK